MVKAAEVGSGILDGGCDLLIDKDIEQGFFDIASHLFGVAAYIEIGAFGINPGSKAPPLFPHDMLDIDFLVGIA